LYIFQVLLFTKKLKKKEYLKHSKFNYNYKTRNKYVYILPKHKTALYEKVLLYSVELFSNKLPDIIRKIENINIYKSALKSFLLQKHIIYEIRDFTGNQLKDLLNIFVHVMVTSLEMTLSSPLLHLHLNF
jgi:hypothetical protein